MDHAFIEICVVLVVHLHNVNLVILEELLDIWSNRVHVPNDLVRLKALKLTVSRE